MAQEKKTWGRERLEPTAVQVPIKTIYEWRTNGTGPTAYRFGKYTPYRACDVDRWLADQVA